MQPSEFLQRYGSPVPLTFTVSAGVDAFIPPDPDRYLIAFLPALSGTSYFFSPDLDRSTTYGGTLVQTGEDARVFDHAHFGAWVNMGWRLTFNMAPLECIVTVVVGRMPKLPPTPKVLNASVQNRPVGSTVVRRSGRNRTR